VNCQTKGILVCKFYWTTVNIPVHFIHRQCGVWTLFHQVVNTVFSSRNRRAHYKYLDSKLKRGLELYRNFKEMAVVKELKEK
jgi:hypothetical protein